MAAATVTVELLTVVSVMGVLVAMQDLLTSCFLQAKYNAEKGLEPESIQKSQAQQSPQS